MSEETFGMLLETNLESVRRLIRRRMQGTEVAEDVIQQTLLRAFVHRNQLRVESRFKSWLWSIAVNEIRMFHRANVHAVSLDELPDLPARDRMPSPFEICERLETVERLRTGLARLSHRDRTAIRLVDLEELTVCEAARVLTVKPAALKSTHFRARRRLGRELGMAA